MIENSRTMILLIAVFLALIMFFGNKQVSEVQSARFYLTWTVDCAKGAAITIQPRSDLAFDWKDPFTGVVEKIVPMGLTCKTNTKIEDRVCKGWISTRASRLEPMNKTHAACYAVP
jgi:hypothetical protein